MTTTEDSHRTASSRAARAVLRLRRGRTDAALGLLLDPSPFRVGQESVAATGARAR